MAARIADFRDVLPHASTVLPNLANPATHRSVLVKDDAADAVRAERCVHLIHRGLEVRPGMWIDVAETIDEKLSRPLDLILIGGREVYNPHRRHRGWIIRTEPNDRDVVLLGHRGRIADECE